MPQGVQVRPVKKLTPSAIVVKTSQVIGVVGSAVKTELPTKYQEKLTEDKGLLLFNSPAEALEVFAGVAGTIREDLDDINLQNVHAPIVVSVASVTASQLEKAPEDFYEVNAFKSRVLEQIENLKLARTIFGKAYKVRWAVAGYFSADVDVQQRLNIFNEGTKTAGVIDLNETSVQGAVKKLEKMGTKRQLVTPFYGQKWSTFENENIFRPLSACIAGHNAYWSALFGEFGDAYSYGNLPIYGITKLRVPLTYEEGAECDVNTLADAGATVVFNDEGWELYNFETPNTDETENKLEYIRFFDMLNEALQKGAKEYHQRPFTEVKEMLQLKIEQFLGKAVDAGVALGFDVWLSPENSGAEVQAGRFYLSYKTGNNPAIRTIILQPFSTSEYADKLVETK